MKTKEFYLKILVVSFAVFQCSWVFAEDASGLEKIQYKTDPSGNRELSIQFKSMPKCLFGDLDAVLLDLKTANGGLALQLSVEPLPLSADRVYYGEAEKNIDTTPNSSLGYYKVRIPSKEKAKSFLVSFCSVSTKDKVRQPCSVKRVVSINDALLPYRVNSSNLQSSSASPLVSQAFQPEAKIYFAQLLFASDDYFAVTSRALNSDLLETILSKLGTTTKESNAIYSEYERFDSTLGSLPISSADTKALIHLPFYDSQRCSGS